MNWGQYSGKSGDEAPVAFSACRSLPAGCVLVQCAEKVLKENEFTFDVLQAPDGTFSEEFPPLPGGFDSGHKVLSPIVP